MSKQHSTLLPKTATMPNEFCVEISSFRQSRTLLRHCCIDLTFLLVWTGLKFGILVGERSNEVRVGESDLEMKWNVIRTRRARRRMKSDVTQTFEILYTQSSLHTTTTTTSSNYRSWQLRSATSPSICRSPRINVIIVLISFLLFTFSFLGYG